jgi:hypothetical protein
MHYKALFPNRYLGSHDLDGKEPVLTIRRVVKEELETDRGKEEKPVVYFVETGEAAARLKQEEKRLILNRTNAATIAGMYGTQVEAWTGKKIQLFTSTVPSFGKQVEAIRIRPTPK